MVAASIWSLLIPAIDQAAYMGKGAVLPAAAVFLAGHSVSAAVRLHHTAFTSELRTDRGHFRWFQPRDHDAAGSDAA